MKQLTVQELISHLRKLPNDLPVRHHKGMGKTVAVRECRVVMKDSACREGEEVDQEPEFVCIY
jgi:hypothetical protein